MAKFKQVAGISDAELQHIMASIPRDIEHEVATAPRVTMEQVHGMRSDLYGRSIEQHITGGNSPVGGVNEFWAEIANTVYADSVDEFGFIHEEVSDELSFLD